MKKNTVYILIGTAAVGTAAFLYLREKKKADRVQASSDMINQAIASTSEIFKRPVPDPVPEPVETVSQTAEVPSTTIDPVAKVYPAFQPISTTSYTRPLTKTNYLLQREISLRGLLL